MSVANYLRYKKSLTGTKVVCSEGDCGACTVILSRYNGSSMGYYQSINSCISFMYLLDKCHLVTIEGLSTDGLHSVQKSMIEHHGAQCGYCTPGIVCSLATLAEDAKTCNKAITEKKVKNYLTGNLCRCTGYEPIITAGLNINLDSTKLFSQVFDHDKMVKHFKTIKGKDVIIEYENKEIFLPITYASLYSSGKIEKSKITSGATDLGVLHNKGKSNSNAIVSLNNIYEAYQIEDNESEIIIGAKASLTDVEKVCAKDFSEFSRKLHVFASPQIKNKGTLVGNLINASPIGDTIPFLIVSGAYVVLHDGESVRKVKIEKFFKGGYKELDLENDEVVTHIILPKKSYEFKLYKVSIRKDLDISTVSMAIAYKLDGDIFTDFRIGFGGVGPVVMRIKELEKEIIGKSIDRAIYQKLAKLIDAEITPLSDLRGSENYRRNLAHNLFLKFCDELDSKVHNKEIEVSL